MSARDPLSNKERQLLSELALELARGDVDTDGFADDYQRLTIPQQGAFTRADEETYCAGLLVEILELRQQRLLERRDSPMDSLGSAAPVSHLYQTYPSAS